LSGAGPLLQELLDREAIKELKARYFRSVDGRDWDEFRKLFVDDAQFHAGVARGPLSGADAFVAFVRDVVERNDARTVHRGHTPEITIDGPADAHGRWLLADYIEWPSDPDTGKRRGMRGYGHYDTYRKIDGVWKIASQGLTYLRIDPLPPDPLPCYQTRVWPSSAGTVVGNP
jgi:SnoaL-like protein